MSPNRDYEMIPLFQYSPRSKSGDDGRELGLKERYGFTLLEVMVAMVIISIALLAVLGSQSQSISLASEARFSTTSALLAQSKMAEIEAMNPDDLISDSGEFGEDYPGYRWEMTVEDVNLDEPENVSDYLKQINLIVSWGENEKLRYHLRLYRFLPEKR